MAVPQNRRRRFDVLVLVSMAFMGAAPLDARSQEPKPTSAPAPPAFGPTELVKSYEVNCAYCHGGDGTGSRMRKSAPTIPDFTSLAWQMSQTDLEIAHRIRDGHEPLMPAYREDLTEPQIFALSIYVRAYSIKAMASTEGRGPLPPNPPNRGRAAPLGEIAAQMSPTAVYHAYCLACHDANGSGTTVRRAMPQIPDFGALQWQQSRSDADLQHSIMEGQGNFMLPMKDRLSQADAARMVAFLRAFRGGKQQIDLEPPKPPTLVPRDAPPRANTATPRSPTGPTPETVARLRLVTRLYRQYCLTCHGADGKGSEMRAGMPTLPDFRGQAWQEGKSDAQLAVSILDGNGKIMPSFRGRVGGNQALDLVAYLRALGPPRARQDEAPRSDFEGRLHRLQQQWDELEKQIQALTPQRRAP